MYGFLKFFLQIGVVNGIYGSLFGRPQRYGIRGLYLDDKSVVGGENGALVPKLAPGQANDFFRHTVLPLPEYDFIIIDASQDYLKSLRKFLQSTKRIIPGGYILVKNTQCRCLKSGKRLIDQIKDYPDYEVLEFLNDGLAIVRLQKPEYKNHNVRPLNATFWVSLGLLGGIVAGEYLFWKNDNIGKI
jgi:hypothetical protein